jgi:hypothetical protein
MCFLDMLNVLLQSAIKQLKQRPAQRPHSVPILITFKTFSVELLFHLLKKFSSKDKQIITGEIIELLSNKSMD